MKAAYKYLIIFSVLLIILGIGATIRLQNLPHLQEGIPLALDPHYFLRMAKTIEETGGLPEQDSLRYSPLGHDPKSENNFLSYTMVYFHKIGQLFFPSFTIEQAVILHPVLFFILGSIVFFFLVREFFNDYIALLATFILVILPSYIYRTLAGFADKESMGLFFMYLALYLSLKAVKEKRFAVSYFYGIGAGLATGLMSLGWGGFKFTLVIISIFYLVLFVLGKITKKHVINYCIWTVIFSFFAGGLILKYGGYRGLITSSTSGIAYLVLGILVVGYFLQNNAFIKKIPLPPTVSIILILGVVGSLFGILVIGQAALYDLFLDAQGMLIKGITNSRLGLTVAENKQPFVANWVQSFGFFLLFFAGGTLWLFKVLMKPLQQAKTLSILFFLFLFGMVFSRTNSYSIFNGETLASQILFFGSFLVLLSYAAFLYFKSFYTNKKQHHEFSRLNSSLIFFFIWLSVIVLAARSGIRLFMLLAPLIAITTAYFVDQMVRKSWNYPEKFYKITFLVVISLIFIPLIVVSTQQSVQSARSTGPSFNDQWKQSMDWVSQNTDEKSVFAHWWDYGYWVQTGANRATITDGGNFIPYWNHLMGRKVLASPDELTALEFLAAHKATHLLIISDEIGKYTAYSSIGSDDNFDIFSWISTFTMIPQATSQEGNIYSYTYSGGSALDENFVYGDKIFPESESYIVGFILPVLEYVENESVSIQQPSAILSLRGVQTEVPVECVYHKDTKIIFEEEGLSGCLRIFPRYLNSRYQQENGALLYVSEIGTEALWTKLFLFNEDSEHFELIYDDSSYYQLASFGGRTFGPLKIWKINYPEDFSVSLELIEEYTAKETPEWLQLDGITI